MCGIAGIFRRDGKDADKARLAKMAKLLEHRGPDNTSLLVTGNVGLSHNRLSLLDLSEAGNQPFRNERYSLVYNGEIYNFKALRLELIKAHDAEFVSESDTEVLFKLLVLEGIEETLRRIEGMFAFAFVDHQEDVLWLARDRIGIKPLFFCDTAAEVVFASEFKALAGTVNLEMDRRRVLESVFGYLEHSRQSTAFQDAYQVTPGTYVEFRKGRARLERTYFRTADLVDADYYRELQRMGHDDVLAEFERLFSNSVEKMLVADAPVGAFVSGGIDSSLISAFAKQLGSNPLLYSVNVKGKFSEIEDARHLARVLGTEINVFDYEPEMFLRDWVKTTWHNDAPVVINQHAVPFGNITRVAARKGDKAVLTGEGADELFLGYPRHVRIKMERALLWPLRMMMKAYEKLPGINVTGIDKNQDVRTFLRATEMQYEDFNEEQSYAEAVSFIRDRHEREMQGLVLRLVDKTLYSLLWRNDRMGMMNSIESRFPYLDEQLLGFAASLPLEYKARRTVRFADVRHPFMIDKYAVRKLASKTLPRKLIEKRKKAFPIHGLESVRVDRRYFSGGFWQELFGLSNAQLDIMYEQANPALISKLAAVEVWGRMFVRQEDQEDVNRALLKYCSMTLISG